MWAVEARPVILFHSSLSVVGRTAFDDVIWSPSCQSFTRSSPSTIPSITVFYPDHESELFQLSLHYFVDYGTLSSYVFSEILVADSLFPTHFHYSHVALRLKCQEFSVTFTVRFEAPHFTLVKEALIEIGCVVTSLVVGWLSRACTVAKRCILGL